VVDAGRGLHRDFMPLLDITIVNVALPPISRSLHAGT
jgi:hypothetical protein